MARRANREDKCCGAFFAERFKARFLAGESAILVCGVYVDLNKIRAGEAVTPEESITRPPTSVSSITGHPTAAAAIWGRGGRLRRETCVEQRGQATGHSREFVQPAAGIWERFLGHGRLTERNPGAMS